MASRNEAREAKKLARQELTKICKAIIINQYVVASSEAPSVDNIILRVRGSQSNTTTSHIEMNINRVNTQVNSYMDHFITGKQLELLNTFLLKHDSNSKKLCGGTNYICLRLKRQPSEEEIIWSEYVFESYNISKDTGQQSAVVRFTATVELTMVNSHSTSSLEDFANGIQELAKRLNDADRMSRISYKEGPVEIASTGKCDIRHQLGWWDLHNNPPENITDL